jgi:hypothetical protein
LFPAAKNRAHWRTVLKNGPRAEAEIHKQHAELDKAIQDNRDITLASADDVWHYAMRLMGEMRFVSAGCPACRRTFGPADCRILGYSYGSGLAAFGGSRVVCPRGHTLFCWNQWHS